MYGTWYIEEIMWFFFGLNWRCCLQDLLLCEWHHGETKRPSQGLRNVGITIYIDIIVFVHCSWQWFAVVYCSFSVVHCGLFFLCFYCFYYHYITIVNISSVTAVYRSSLWFTFFTDVTVFTITILLILLLVLIVSYYGRRFYCNCSLLGDTQNLTLQNSLPLPPSPILSPTPIYNWRCDVCWPFFFYCAVCPYCIFCRMTKRKRAANTSVAMLSSRSCWRTSSPTVTTKIGLTSLRWGGKKWRAGVRGGGKAFGRGGGGSFHCLIFALILVLFFLKQKHSKTAAATNKTWKGMNDFCCCCWNNTTSSTIVRDVTIITKVRHELNKTEVALSWFSENN